MKKIVQALSVCGVVCLLVFGVIGCEVIQWHIYQDKYPNATLSDFLLDNSRH